MGISVSDPATLYWESRSSVEGAFWDIDFRLFDELLAAQDSLDVRGDLLEIGALYGKSAILLGVHGRLSETVHICDVFERDSGTSTNRAENDSSYPGLTRARFESNYRTHVTRNPYVIQELSSSISRHVKPGTLRFAHVDGGHLYETVADDLRNVKRLLGSRGIVVLDDFRALHTPGVAAAAWAEVVGGGLVPFALSEQKMYATWGRAAEYSRCLDAWLARSTDIENYGYQSIAGHTVLVVENFQQPTTLGLRVTRRLFGPLFIPKGPRPHLGARERAGSQ